MGVAGLVDGRVAEDGEGQVKMVVFGRLTGGVESSSGVEFGGAQGGGDGW